MRSVQLRRGTYVDSVTLMQVSRRVAALDGVTSALVAMATELNLDLADGMGFEVPPSSPNELLVAVEAAVASTTAARRGRPGPGRGVPAGPVRLRQRAGAGDRRARPRPARRRPSPWSPPPASAPFADAVDALDAGLLTHGVQRQRAARAGGRPQGVRRPRPACW